MSATDLPSARNAVAAGLEAPRTNGLFSDTITNILSALSAMPLADRLALARALVPECAVPDAGTDAEAWEAAWWRDHAESLAQSAELTTLRAEVARLREALERLVAQHHAGQSTLYAWNAARAALEPKP